MSGGLSQSSCSEHVVCRVFIDYDPLCRSRVLEAELEFGLEAQCTGQPLRKALKFTGRKFEVVLESAESDGSNVEDSDKGNKSDEDDRGGGEVGTRGLRWIKSKKWKRRRG